MAIDVKPKPRRLYKTADGKRVPGVTTILNNIGWKTPGLVWWAFRLGQAEPDMNSPYDKTEEAADIGTVVHRAVELLMHGLPDAEAEKHIADNLPPESIRQAENCLLAFYQWRDGFKLGLPRHLGTTGRLRATLEREPSGRPRDGLLRPENRQGVGGL
jgi:hypothetical protein